MTEREHIHPVSETLGALKTDVKYLRERADKHEAELKSVTKLLGDLNLKLTPIVTDVAEMKPHVDHYSGVRRKAGWLNSVIVFVAGTSGGAVTTFLLKKFGG
jgi:hypothetical protein